MKTLTRDNADRLLRECADMIRAAGDEGLEVATLDEPIDHYLAGLLSALGRVALVTRNGRQYFVWLKRKARKPPVVIEE